MEHPLKRPAAVRHALLLGLEVVVVSSAPAVREELAAAEDLVEVETGNVAGTDAFVFGLGTGV